MIKNYDSLCDEVKICLREHSVVQVSDTTAFEALAVRFPDAHCVDFGAITTNSPQKTNPFESLGIRAPEDVQQDYDDTWMPYLVEHYQPGWRWWHYADREQVLVRQHEHGFPGVLFDEWWSEMSKLGDVVVIVRRIESVPFDSSESFDAALYSHILAWLVSELAEAERVESLRLVLVSNDCYLTDRLAGVIGKAPSRYPIINTRGLNPIPGSNIEIAYLATYLFCGEDRELTGLIVSWLDESYPSWKDDWVTALRTMRLGMLKCVVQEVFDDNTPHVWRQACADSLASIDLPALIPRLVEHYQTDFRALSNQAQALTPSLADVRNATLASAIGMWIDIGRLFMARTWTEEQRDVDRADLLPSTDPMGRPKRFRSVPHGWAARQLIVKLRSLPEGGDELRCAVPVVRINPELSARVLFRLTGHACSSAEIAQGWEKSTPEDRDRLLQAIHIAGNGADTESTVLLLAALCPDQSLAMPHRNTSVQGDERGGSSSWQNCVVGLSGAHQIAQIVIDVLGDDRGSKLLDEYSPNHRGDAQASLVEWLIGKEWAEDVSLPLARYLGLPGAEDLAEATGVATSEGTPEAIIEEVFRVKGLPMRPRVQGLRVLGDEIAKRISEAPLYSREPDITEMENLVRECGARAERILRTTLFFYADIFDWFSEKSRNKLKDFKRNEGNNLAELFERADFAHLISLLGFLRKHTNQGGKHELSMREMLGEECKITKESINLLDKLREARNSAAHLRDERPIGDAHELYRLGLEGFVEVWDKGGLRSIVPMCVYKKGTSQDAWGKHMSVLDEFGKEYTILLVDIGLGTENQFFYVLPRNNPQPVAPLMKTAPHGSRERRLG